MSQFDVPTYHSNRQSPATVTRQLDFVFASRLADSLSVRAFNGATEANNLALLGLARGAGGGRRRILVSAIEHKCVLGAARALSAREGFTVETISVDREGFVDFDELEQRLDGDVLLLSVMAVNNEVGTIQDIPRIAKLLAPHGVLFHCDAAQAPCAMDVSGLATHTDLMSLSGHKMYGPQGIGALYIRRDLKELMEPLFYGGGQQEGLRSGTVPMPLCVGMAEASEIIADDEAEEERTRIARQCDSFISLLQCGNSSATVNGPIGRLQPPSGQSTTLPSSSNSETVHLTFDHTRSYRWKQNSNISNLFRA